MLKKLLEADQLGLSLEWVGWASQRGSPAHLPAPEGCGPHSPKHPPQGGLLVPWHPLCGCALTV
ncbi:conserved hypothetical protein [Thermus scotoductus SA-01]|uniref:Uncharacterized protein n=1 Tax=Thermus scotoductus (strain ATCC 700910 / SA-01) TaxID=743525 RepID=E8PMA6_THESS|nr:conserved hypothetical protein [Thermus scotoductus SA-01]